MKRARRSLFLRNVLLIGLVIALAELTMFLSFVSMVVKPRSERIAVALAHKYIALRAGLHDLPPGQRQALVDRLNAAAAKEAVPPPARWMNPLMKAMEQRYHGTMLAYMATAGLPATLSHGADGLQDLRLELVVEGQPYRLRVAGVVPMITPLQDWMLLVAVAGLLFALLGAWLIQGWISRPLRGLVGAAREIGAGRHPAPLPEDGPDEIAIVARSFNRMSADLARINEDRALMLAGLSHDLRTPLAKLRLCVEMLRSGADASLIESMIRSIDTADAVIGQFIEFARIGSDEQAQWCDPAELVTSVGNEFAGRSNCAVKLDLQPAPALRVRPVALRRAIANLVENACRYAPGEIVVRLEAGDGKLRFSVLDQGPGVPAPELARIRQPFTRLTSSRGQLPGAGLGLAIVERIAALHRGQLRLENREQGGLAAMIELPAATEKEAELLGPTE